MLTLSVVCVRARARVAQLGAALNLGLPVAATADTAMRKAAAFTRTARQWKSSQSLVSASSR